MAYIVKEIDRTGSKKKGDEIWSLPVSRGV